MGLDSADIVISCSFISCLLLLLQKQRREKNLNWTFYLKNYFSNTRVQYTKCPYPVSVTLFLLTLGPPFPSNFMPIFILRSSNLSVKTHVVGLFLFQKYYILCYKDKIILNYWQILERNTNINASINFFVISKLEWLTFC